MGIINWANLKLEFLPKIDKIFFMPFDNLDDAIEPIYKIPRIHLGQEFLLLNHVDLALILAKNWPDDFDKLVDILPTWTLILTISGPPRRPEERIEYEIEALEEDQNRLPWEDGLPREIRNSLDPFKSLLLESYNAMLNPFELIPER